MKSAIDEYQTSQVLGTTWAGCGCERPTATRPFERQGCALAGLYRLRSTTLPIEYPAPNELNTPSAPGCRSF